MPKEVPGFDELQKDFQTLFAQNQSQLREQFKFFPAHEILSQAYAYSVLLKNQQLNLTALTTIPKVYHLHFIDALYLEYYIEKFLSAQGKSLYESRFADVGTGAGFPGLYLHSLFPKKEIYLIDALKKRLVYLEELYEQMKALRIKLALEDKTLDCVFSKPYFVHGRAEDLGHQAFLREKMDVVCARAVASLPTLLEYCMPFVKEGAYFFAMKGSKDELQLAQTALKKLNTRHIDTFEYQLDFDQEIRKIYVFKKEAPLDKKYPRKAPLPSTKPL